MILALSEHFAKCFSFQGSVRPAVVAKVFPFGQFLVQIHIISEAQQLIEFVLAGSMGAFYFAV